MSRSIWTVAHDPQTLPLGYFSSREAARQYAAALTERYSLGQNLKLHGKPLAGEAGAWNLGLGPEVIERSIDDTIDNLPGAWMVKVDETCRMIACTFSTKHRPRTSTIHYRTGIHTICEAYASTPHLALDNARKAMMSYLSKNRSFR